MTSCIAASASTLTSSANNAVGQSIFSAAAAAAYGANHGLILPPSSSSNNNNNNTTNTASSLLFPQQQFPQAIPTLLNTQARPLHQASSNVYNGIFLVDGLGSGIRIDQSPAARPTMSTMTSTLCSSAGPNDPSLHQIGLPAVHSSPMRHQHQTSSSSTTNPLCIRIDSSTNTNANANMTNANNNGVGDNLLENRFSVTCNNTSQNHYSNGSTALANQTNNAGIVIPLVAGNVTANTAAAASASSMPKYNRNSVTLSVPSPPLVSASSSSPSNAAANSQGSSSPTTNPVVGCSPQFSALASNTAAAARQAEMTRTNIAVVPNATVTVTPISSPNSSPPRTLISTEAQTEDVQLPGLSSTVSAALFVPPPPPPNRGNREQRKRERRERRRDRNSHHHYLSHTNGSGIARNHMSGPSTHHHGHSSRHAHSNAAYSSNSTMDANGTGSEHLASSSQFNAHPSGGPQNDSSSTSIPDLLLNSQLPPPYSTLPQHSERRLVAPSVPLSSVPIPMSQQMMIPMMSANMNLVAAANSPNASSPPPPPQQMIAQFQLPPQCMGPPPPSICQPGGPQPVRYHFAAAAAPAPSARTIRRSVNANYVYTIHKLACLTE